jgi:hypothetical protein
MLNKSKHQKNKLYRLIGYRVYEKTKENVQFVRLANIIEFVRIVLLRQKRYNVASKLGL